MAYNVLYGLRLKGATPGGIVGERMGQLLFLTVFFALAYLGVLLTWSEPSSLLLLLPSLILLLGAVFVYLVLRLVDAIVASL